MYAGIPTHDSNVSRRTFSQEEMMSEGGDHESWDDEMMMNENNETPLPVVRPIIVKIRFSLFLFTCRRECARIIKLSLLKEVSFYFLLHQPSY